VIRASTASVVMSVSRTTMFERTVALTGVPDSQRSHADGRRAPTGAPPAGRDRSVG